jgi:hypothetical protein
MELSCDSAILLLAIYPKKWGLKEVFAHPCSELLFALSQEVEAIHMSMVNERTDKQNVYTQWNSIPSLKGKKF